ncbi:methylated-DNA--[protein]-cysteine S-methyltransferase [Clostridium sp. Marseille-P2415]|uniref:methylated-DNA--[protein]-cysteine S-methyltransferase n=1 Tax=Clostridium sp. Marseille-P2415 TaxID=1805471 RepID=UPI0009887F51|nr:methylated-DNA--[protein]-cysteine S-methyltransferase [Clostridium sp. Marseille-P2415]
MKFWETFETDLGALTVVCDEEALLCIDFGETEPQGAIRKHTEMIEKTAGQLKEYLAGRRQVFELPLKPEGTAFQKKVWNALLTVPYGETRSYGDIAVQIDNPKAFRAVGMANNRNPIPIIIPCHRIIGAGGSLVGYGGGLDIKVKLLELEQPGFLWKNY